MIGVLIYHRFQLTKKLMTAQVMLQVRNLFLIEILQSQFINFKCDLSVFKIDSCNQEVERE